MCTVRNFQFLLSLSSSIQERREECTHENVRNSFQPCSIEKDIETYVHLHAIANNKIVNSFDEGRTPIKDCVYVTSCVYSKEAGKSEKKTSFISNGLYGSQIGYLDAFSIR